MRARELKLSKQYDYDFKNNKIIIIEELIDIGGLSFFLKTLNADNFYIVNGVVYYIVESVSGSKYYLEFVSKIGVIESYIRNQKIDKLI